MKTTMLCVIMILIIVEGSSGRKHRHPRTGAEVTCDMNEQYGCRPCFEPSCNQILYDNEVCDTACVLACSCKLGFVLKRDKCVVKESCCAGNMCKTKKEVAVREAQEAGVTPDPRRWAQPEVFRVDIETEAE
ncbi:Hypothetical predicted protein [Drosophila guanche]|uniref:TIL domain-containing protein n=1 Tax=Drosophila guanche TaxID=7266 RepID=A0A3B0KCN0_DROGU|nr:Hypothetical predicted protein [Drosophila guanche]